MHDVSLVEVTDRLSDRFEELLCLGFLHLVLGFWKEVVVKRICTSVLLNQVDLGWGLNDLDQPSYDWMVEFSQNVDLAL